MKIIRASTFLVLFIALFGTPSFGALGDIITSFAAPGWGSRGLAWDGTNLWHSDQVSDTIYKLNPADGSVISSFAAPSLNSADLTFVGSDLWNVDIFSRSFYSVAPNAGPPWTLEFSKPGNDYFGLAYDGTNLWASDFNSYQIDKMDLNGNVISSFSAPDIGGEGLAWDGTYLWSSDTNTDLIYKIDPSTGNVLASFPTPSNNPTGLTFDGQYLWATDIGANQVWQIDAGYAAPLGPSPAPPTIVNLLVMLATFGVYLGFGKLRERKRKA